MSYNFQALKENSKLLSIFLVKDNVTNVIIKKKKQEEIILYPFKIFLTKCIILIYCISIYLSINVNLF